jgi:lipopolysaccharide transport system permease protein
MSIEHSHNDFKMTETAPAMAMEERVIRPRHGLGTLDLLELWRYRELFWFLAWRDILIRYKQTYIGIAWAVVQPLLTMVVFTIVFGRLAGMKSNGAAYTVMTFAGLLPWTFFSNAMRESSNSLIASSNMISKIYFPRLIIPASAVLSGLVDFAIALALMFGLMCWYQVPFTPRLLLLPAFFGIAFLAALATGLWLSALNVKYRDVKYIVPFFVQMGLYVSPVGYMTSVAAEKAPAWFHWYCLNPMVGVIDGFRWCTLGPQFEPYWPGVWTSVAGTLILLITGAFYFRTAEKTFADLI